MVFVYKHLPTAEKKKITYERIVCEIESREYKVQDSERIETERETESEKTIRRQKQEEMVSCLVFKWFKNKSGATVCACVYT